VAYLGRPHCGADKRRYPETTPPPIHSPPPYLTIPYLTPSNTHCNSRPDVCRCSFHHPPISLRVASTRQYQLLSLFPSYRLRLILTSALAPPFESTAIDSDLCLPRSTTTTPPNPRPRCSPRWSIARRIRPRGSSRSTLAFSIHYCVPFVFLKVKLSCRVQVLW
jgi:hypothetical protein